MVNPQLQEVFDVVVVEGPDGAGKTTLVETLSEKFGLEVGQRGVANRDDLYKVTRQDTYRALALEVQGTTPAFIWDRLFVSEFVYADVVGRGCEFKLFERKFVVDMMNALSFPMVVCLPPLSVVEANCDKVHQMKGVNENLHTIYERYARGKLPWPENTIWFDYTGQQEHFASFEDIEVEVEGYLEARKERQAWD